MPVARINPAMIPQQQGGGSLIGSLAGNLGGKMIGTALGGPLGGAIGGAIGKQVGGTGTVSAGQAAADVVDTTPGQQATDKIIGKGADVLQENVIDKLPGFNLPFFNQGGAVYRGGGGPMTGHRATGGKFVGGENHPGPGPDYYNRGGKLMAPMGTSSFMMEHSSGTKERMGPLAKTSYKNKGGEVWERHYHNPLMVGKPSAEGE